MRLMHRLFRLIVFIAVLFRGQDFTDYRNSYDNYEENDERAFQYLKPYIAKAKGQRNYRELTQAYKDAVSFSRNQKIIFADSMITAARRTADNDLLATAFLTKGTVYYFNYRKFKPALDEYMEAWLLTQHSNNRYLHYKNLYHIGVVKSYLGYYQEALGIFEQCAVYFRKPVTLPEAPNVHYNRKKGYLNTLNQIGRCYLQLSQWKEAAATVDNGLRESGSEADFYAERSYFHLLEGILAFRQKKDAAAITLLNTSLAGLEKKNDFTSASVAYYYKGKSEAQLGRTKSAVENFVKIDSIFRMYQFILPEVRGSYEFLIDHYHRSGGQKLELYYTTQLLKADQIISGDFKYLSEKIYKEYDTPHLLASKKRLERSLSMFSAGLAVGATVFIMLLIYLLIRMKRQRKHEGGKTESNVLQNGVKEKRTVANPEVVQKVPDAVTKAVLAKLAVMEKNKFFLQQRVTLHQLAPQLGTNSNYLSMIVKEYRGSYFLVYLKQLRIEYVTRMLREDKKWRHYSVETLANECGFADRTHFSRAFAEYNKMKPGAFIRKLEAESAAANDDPKDTDED